MITDFSVLNNEYFQAGNDRPFTGPPPIAEVAGPFQHQHNRLFLNTLIGMYRYSIDSCIDVVSLEILLVPTNLSIFALETTKRTQQYIN
jgi:hypothetical protein